MGSGRATMKVPSLVALIKAVVPTDSDFRITLRDPTGEIDGALQRKAMEAYPGLVCGSVVVLEQVTLSIESLGEERRTKCY